MNCESCGLPLEKPEDQGENNINVKYCVHCAPNGTLKSRKEIKEGWINFLVKSENLSLEEATKHVAEQMAKMPAWQNAE